MKNKLLTSKTAKGLMAMIAVVILLSSMLAASFFYQNGNSITAATAAVAANYINAPTPPVKEASSISELSQLNEGWYRIINGNVFYLEHFDSAIPLYIKIKNSQNLNGLMIIDSYGSIQFNENEWDLAGNKLNVKTEENKNKISENQITGNAVGLEGIIGFQTAQAQKYGWWDMGGGLQWDYGTESDLKKLIDSGTVPPDTKLITTKPTSNPSGNYFDLRLNNGQGAFVKLSDFKPQPITPPPPPTAPPVPGSPSAPAIPTPPPIPTVYSRPQDIPNDGKPYQAIGINGGQWYRRAGGNFYVYTGSQNSEGVWSGDWGPAKFRYTVTITMGTQQLSQPLDAESKQDAGNQARSRWGSFNPVVTEGAPSQQAPAPTAQQWTLLEFGGKKFAVKGNEFQDIPTSLNEQYVNILISNLNTRDSLRNEFTTYSNQMKSAGITDERLILQAWVDSHPKKNEEIFKETFAAQQQQLQARGATERDPLKPVSTINGVNYYVAGGRIFPTTTSTPPQQVIDIVNFQKDVINRGAQLQPGLTANGEQVYLFQGKYVSMSNRDVKEAVKEEDIAGKKYEITFELKDGKKTATRINGEGVDTFITNEELALIRRYSAQGYSFSVIGGVMHLIRESIEKGKDETQIKTTSELTLGQRDVVTSITRVETRDKDGNLVGSRETEYAGLWRREKIYDIKDGEIVGYVEQGFDPRNGAPMWYEFERDNNRYRIDFKENKILGPDGRELTAIEIEQLRTDIRNQINKNKNNLAKWTSRRVFANFEKVFTEYRGLGYIPTLFGFGDEFLAQWRDNVDRAFAKTYLGTEYWSSKICQQTTNIQQEGIAFADTPQGLLQVGAHIEATRTQPIVDETGKTSFIYKITFQVRNGDFDKDLRAPENMSVNAVIKGIEGATHLTNSNIALPSKKVILYKQDINIGRGSAFGKTGPSAIVKSSNTYYTDICLTFDKIPLRWKIDKKENGRWVLCNRVQESSGEPTQIQTAAAAASQTNPDSNLNDF